MRRVSRDTGRVCILIGAGVPAVAVAGNVLHVPEDYATIQEAVDAAAAMDTIRVGPGDHSGAVIDRVPVVIEGSGPTTRITADNEYFLWPGEDAFDIFGASAWPGYCPELDQCGADGTEIRELAIDGGGGAFFWGVAIVGADNVVVHEVDIADTPFGVSGDGADAATVTDTDITDCFQGIASWGGDGWTIEDNRISGVVMPPWRGDKHADMVLLAGHGSGHRIADNRIEHEGRAVCTSRKRRSPCGPEHEEFYLGIGLVAWDGPMEGNEVVDNVVTISVKGADMQAAIALVDYSLLEGGPALVKGNTIGDNTLVGGLDLVPEALADLNRLLDD